ncbi:hypothetical protein AYK24_10290 [Thermoplasmatales archaeon SG8-52-4]|jgi:hypothetical protein|nr:MAG: hypothetical protein AYK24_10290 [Thermoplasmatales archaeon SG8-52-4]
MKNTLFKKGLVLGIIVLFIFLGVIPSFNAISISKSVDNISKSNNETEHILIIKGFKNVIPRIHFYYDFQMTGMGTYETFDLYINWENLGYEESYYNNPNGGVLVPHSWTAPGVYTIKAEAWYNHSRYTATFDVRVIGRAKNIDIEEDCDCQSNGKTHLAEKIINRLEKNEVLSDGINSGNLIYGRPICNILDSLFNHYRFYIYFYRDLKDNYPKGSFLYNFYSSLSQYSSFMTAMMYILGLSFDCWDYPPIY